MLSIPASCRWSLSGAIEQSTGALSAPADGQAPGELDVVKQEAAARYAHFLISVQMRTKLLVSACQQCWQPI